MKIKSFYLLLLLASIGLASSIEKNLSLKPGDMAPDFSASDHKGKIYRLSEQLKKGPVILLFYRGEWCPFCNRYLSNIQDSISYIKEAGASVAAVSPENGEGMKKTVYKTAARFPLVSDTDKKIAQLYGTADQYSSVPVPATFVIGRDGIIKYIHFDKDYQKRPSVAALLHALK